MRSRNRLVVVYLISLAVVAPHVARATDAPVVTAEGSAMTDKARQLYEEGLSAYKKERWAESRAALLAAWSLNKHWQIAGLLADCEVQIGRYRDAAEHAAYYLKNSPADRHDRATKLLSDAKAKIATLTLQVAPAGAEILIDGVSVGRAPLADALFLDSGAHNVVARIVGRPDAERAVTMKAGSAESISLTVGNALEPSPIEPNEPQKVTPLIVLGGIAAAGLATGAGLFVAGNGKLSTAEDLHKGVVDAHGSCVPGASNFDARCAEIDKVSTSADTLHRVGFGVMVGGGVAAVGAVVYLLWPSSKPTTGMNVRVLPVATTSGGGLFASGNF
jgi:hypothetical protein